MAYSKEILPAHPNSSRAYFLASFGHDVSAAKAQIKKFTELLLEDPGHVLNNAEKQFTAAAMIAVSNQVIHLLEHTTDVKDIVAQLHENIMNKARYISGKSSGPCTNMWTDALCVAYCEAWDRLRGTENLDN